MLYYTSSCVECNLMPSVLVTPFLLCSFTSNDVIQPIWMLAGGWKQTLLQVTSMWATCSLCCLILRCIMPTCEDSKSIILIIYFHAIISNLKWWGNENPHSSLKWYHVSELYYYIILTWHKKEIDSYKIASYWLNSIQC